MTTDAQTAPENGQPAEAAADPAPATTTVQSGLDTNVSMPKLADAPTEEEDAALRDERARRFGRPRPEAVGGTEGNTGDAAADVATTALASTGAAATSQMAADSSTRTMPTTPAPATTAPNADDDDPFSEFDDGPTSRAASHWWSILISLVFVPVSWYLIADGGERVNFALGNGNDLPLWGIVEFAGGVLCLFFVLLAARWSSVGAILTGVVTTLLGGAFLAVNDKAMSIVEQYQGTVVQALNQFGQNIIDHLLADAASGRLAVYGVVLIMVGVISHGARRQGRREEKRNAALGL